MRVAVPFLKWAGGKSVIADKIIAQIRTVPPDATYFEPFLGGGAVFFRLRPRKAVLIDSNAVLIRTYLVVKERVEDLISILRKMPSPDSRKSYEARRTEFNNLLPAPAEGPLTSEDLIRASLLIWLNHTCYNGLYRVNKDGQFNVPFGYYEDAFIFDEDNLRASSRTLKESGAKLVAEDYTIVLSMAKRGDVLYFDPPYHPLDNTDGFTEYTANGFGSHDQACLARLVQQLMLKGARPIVSNSNASDVKELYKDLGHKELLVPRAINCDGTKRGRIVEMLFFPKNTTLHSLWDTVVDKEGFKLDSGSLYHVSSQRVKELTGKEPRLVAKMDSRGELPFSWRKQGYFVLPSSFNEYAIVPGDGYHDLENIDLKPTSFNPTREVPVTVALKAGESAAIQTAIYNGLLEEALHVPRLRETLHNDKLRLEDTVVRYGDKWKLSINGAQFELDAGIENHREFFVFECKDWTRKQLHDFNVRQLLFPYLHSIAHLRAQNLDWQVRCFFLNVEPDTHVYRLWEYKFPETNDYSRIELVRQSAFQLTEKRRVDPTALLGRLIMSPTAHTNYVPQANDPTKLLALVQGVAEGIDTPSQVASRLQFVERQSDYYGEAAEELGLLERKRGKFTLTGEGSKIVAMSGDGAVHALVERILTLPVFHEAASLSIKEGNPAIPYESLLPILQRCAGERYNGTTLRRRTQSVKRWINWIGETTGTIRVREPWTRIKSNSTPTLEFYR